MKRITLALVLGIVLLAGGLLIPEVALAEPEFVGFKLLFDDWGIKAAYGEEPYYTQVTARPYKHYIKRTWVPGHWKCKYRRWVWVPGYCKKCKTSGRYAPVHWKYCPLYRTKISRYHR